MAFSPPSMLEKWHFDPRIVLEKWQTGPYFVLENVITALQGGGYASAQNTGADGLMEVLPLLATYILAFK